MPTAAEIKQPTFQKPSIAADIVVFTRITEDSLKDWEGWREERPDNRGEAPTKAGWHVLTIGRRNPPYPHEQGYHCLPGGFVDYGKEDPHGAAQRELTEETHLNGNRKMKLVEVFGNPKRDPRSHVITVAYTCILTPEEARAAYGGDDAIWTQWVPTADITAGCLSMGFDHKDIVLKAMQVGLR